MPVTLYRKSYTAHATVGHSSPYASAPEHESQRSRPGDSRLARTREAARSLAIAMTMHRLLSRQTHKLLTITTSRRLQLWWKVRSDRYLASRSAEQSMPSRARSSCPPSETLLA